MNLPSKTPYLCLADGKVQEHRIKAIKAQMQIKGITFFIMYTFLFGIRS
jgi:hypothetical protein